MKVTMECSKASRILEVAFQLFLEQGYEATGIRSICNMACAELPTLYYHFGSKKGLFLSLAKNLIEEYEPDALRHTHSKDAVSYLCDYFLISIKYAMQHYPQTRFYFRYSLFPPIDLKEEIISFHEGCRNAQNTFIVPAMLDCIQSGFVNLSIDQATSSYWRFINHNAFDIVFSGWSPSENELRKLWHTFLRCRLSGDQEMQ